MDGIRAQASRLVPAHEPTIRSSMGSEMRVLLKQTQDLLERPGAAQRTCSPPFLLGSPALLEAVDGHLFSYSKRERRLLPLRSLSWVLTPSALLILRHILQAVLAHQPR